MPKERSPNRDRAFEIYKEHGGNITNREIAALLQEDEKVIAVWKSRDKWNVVQQSKKCCTTKKKGGQPQNKNAEKYGFFSKYLPEETREIFLAINEANPLDLLWHQIQLAYAAIIRAQHIAYVKDQQDKTIEKVEEKYGNVIGERWEVQQAWDKHNEFLKAQARAQGELRALIKQYDEMLHLNWEMATEEQRTRIALMKVRAQLDDEEELQDDGFLEALNGQAAKDWENEEEETDI